MDQEQLIVDLEAQEADPELGKVRVGQKVGVYREAGGVEVDQGKD